MNANELSNESLLWRSPPPSPYLPGTTVLVAPRRAVEHTLSVFGAYARAGVEACCFWYGTPSSPDRPATVRAVIVPKQRNWRGHYNVDADAVSAVARAANDRGWRNLSQVHSHPGKGVEHSRYDDANANSRRALSLVFPWYGHWRGSWPTGVGVHEFQNDYWHLLSEGHAARRVTLSDENAELLDTRQ